MDPSELTPRQIASNCANPTGEIGRLVGNWMNKANLLISQGAYAHLQVNHGDRVLEIGPGNGALVGHLVTNDNGVVYKAIDISKTMVDAARVNNADMVTSGRVEFLLAPAEMIPFADSSFERAVAVNCIVFWDIAKALKEVYRVLTPGGRLVVTSNSLEAMASNPFAKPENGFKNFDLSKETLLSLHVNSGFKLDAIEEFDEDAKRVDGSSFVRKSYITIAVK